MLLLALIILSPIFIYLNVTNGNISEQSFWFIRVLTMISASTISISLPGTINIGKESDQFEIQTMAQKELRLLLVVRFQFLY
ncbi:hypothetical protein D7036_17615 [Aquimarina sp. BL5]|uniref:hypothetical protein n=1 Tax=Aquimarina sp. BL5 TaxID=1714860 RepID=UPI000EAA8F6E|nr:hypothetical protein [Aquimarina sp. BL5]RKN01554.1 hypothetical protein D7036_17615 [Aquimarina sp. BL5]